MQKVEESNSANSDDSANNKWQVSVRSNILKRIYEKNLRLTADEKNSEKDAEIRKKDENVANANNDNDGIVANGKSRSSLLSRDWRKTLERVLNYDQSYLDYQLDVSRKDALCFFIQKEWPTEDGGQEDDDEDDDDDDAASGEKGGKKNRRNKNRNRKQKTKKSPTPERNLVEQPNLFVRKSKIFFKDLLPASSLTRRSSILTYDSNNDSNNNNALETIRGKILPSHSMYERVILRSTQKLDYLRDLSYLFRRNENSKSFRFFSWLFSWFDEHNPARLNQNFAAKSSSSSSLSLTSSPNFSASTNRFVLQIGSAEISFSKHYSMGDEQRQVRNLATTFERYRQSICPKVDRRLQRLRELIETISAKIEKEGGDDDHHDHTDSEFDFDIDLLRRLLDEYRATIDAKRKALIDLLRVWDRVISHKLIAKLVTNNCLNLSLDEQSDVDEAAERAELNALIERNLRWETIADRCTDSDRIKANAFLSDGRLPGEPKFSNIDLFYESSKHPNFSKTTTSNTWDAVIQIEIFIGDKKVAHFEPLALPFDFSNLKWDSSSCAVPLVLISSFEPLSSYRALTSNNATESAATSSSSSSSFDNRYYHNQLPRILIYEKLTTNGGASKTNRQSNKRLLREYTIDDLPGLHQRSLSSGKEIDFDIDHSAAPRSKEMRIRAKFRCILFWSAIPYDAKTVAASPGVELILDKAKRSIKQMYDLRTIERALHDLRYLSVIELTDVAGDESENSLRRIQLMDMLLRQKYQIELDEALSPTKQIEKNPKINDRNSSENRSPSSDLESLPDGVFCRDEDIEQDRRFRLMMLRNADANRACRQLRFIPLANVTEVMLKSVLIGERSEKFSLDLLLDYVRNSCASQERRIGKSPADRKRRPAKRGKKSSKQSKSGIESSYADGCIFQDWCMLATPGDADKSRLSNNIIVNSSSWLQTIGQVFEKLEQDQRDRGSEDLDTNGDNTNINRQRILSRDDIIRENFNESFSSSDFSFFSPLSFGVNRRKLNPSRKDRRKAAITFAEAIEHEVQVVISVNQAVNVPLRRKRTNNIDGPSNDDDDEEDDDDEDDDNYVLDRYKQCSTFVEIKYGDQCMTTSVSDGSQPMWNESFRFKLKLDPKQYISLSLFEINESSTNRSNNLSPEIDMVGKSTHRFKESQSRTQSGDKKAKNRTQKSEDYFDFEKRYLGQVKIPIFAILINSKIEGTFPLSSPYFLLGHRSVSVFTNQSTRKSQFKFSKPNAEDVVTQMQSLYLHDSQRTLLDCLPDIGLSLFLTADPPIAPIPGMQFPSKNHSLESLQLIDSCVRWRNQLSLQFRDRHYVSLVRNLEHRLVLACRFISPIAPPTLAELVPLDLMASISPKMSGESAETLSGKRPKSASSMMMKKIVHKEALHLSAIIRYVSLIPVYYRANSSSGGDVGNREQSSSSSSSLSSWWWSTYAKTGSAWLDAAQFLSFRVGFQAEHATYLCGMLRYLGRNAYLAFGTSMLDGPIATVILYPSVIPFASTSDDEDAANYEPIIIDARSGHRLSVRDHNITLCSIDCIITNDNIYANIQKNSHPNSMQYNLSKSNHWLPLRNTKKDRERFSSTTAKRLSAERAESESSPSVDDDDNDIVDADNDETSGLQPKTISYSDSINREAASGLEAKLEAYIRDQLIAWRRKQAMSFTSFNRYCTQIVRGMLPRFELHACLHASVTAATTLAENRPKQQQQQRQQLNAIEQAILRELRDMSTVHRVAGAVLHVSPEIDFEQIARLIQSMSLHTIDCARSNDLNEGSVSNSGGANAAAVVRHKMVEFIISAYVHAYPANVHSIWLYVGALITDDQA